MLNEFLFVFLIGLAAGVPMQPDLRIIGGETAPDAAYPYLASLRWFGLHVCGGSIITPTTILTAAHCIDGIPKEELSVVVGTNHINNSGTSYRVVELKEHPEYFYPTNKNDVGLVIVSPRIEFNVRVQPIEIKRDYIDAGVKAVLAGWGTTTDPSKNSEWLQHINLNTISFDDCYEMFYQIGWYIRIYESSLCTMTKFGEGACYGDSGSPLVTSGAIIGIVSWGYPCAKGYPDVFARISHFYSWIDANKM